MMLRTSALAAILAVGACAKAPAPEAADWTALDGRGLSHEEIDATAGRLIAAHEVTGLALALIADGEVRYVRAYGLRDVEKNLPLETATVMYGASLTKATFAYFVMKLVDEGRIDLDRSIADYLPKPLTDYEDYADLAGDERWKKLTFRILLSHTPGFANFRFFDRYGDYVEDGKLAIYFEPGSRYAYSGEGILLAQRVLERGLGMDVGAEMQKRIFDPLGMPKTSMIWREDFRENYAVGYGDAGQRIGHALQDDARAPGSMDTTVADWSKFLAVVARGDGLSPASHAKMIRQQIRIHSATQFPTLRNQTTDEYDAIDLGYGLGWGVFETPYGHAFFKEGHDDGTSNYALCIEPKKTCLLIMSNSIRAEGIFKEMADTLLGETNLPWRWENYIPYDLEEAAP